MQTDFDKIDFNAWAKKAAALYGDILNMGLIDTGQEEHRELARKICSQTFLTGDWVKEQSIKSDGSLSHLHRSNTVRHKEARAKLMECLRQYQKEHTHEGV